MGDYTHITHIYTYIYIKGDLLQGIDSCNHEESAACKLVTQESHRCHLVPVCKPENQSKGKRKWDDVFQLKQWGRIKRGKFLLPPLFVKFRPSTSWRRPTQLGSAIYLTESTNSNAHLIQKHPHWHTQKQCSIWHSWPAKLTHKINPHTSKVTLGAHTCAWIP